MRPRTTFNTLKRLAAAEAMRLTRRPERNRRRFFAGQRGLRMLVFHQVFPEYRRHFEQLIEWCQATFDMAGPHDVDALHDGTFTVGKRDKLLVTFDDGFANNFDVGCWLARRGIHATFFVIPSYLGRTTAEFLEFHRGQSVDAFPMGHRAPHQPCRGMTRDHVRELRDLGHRIAAHNYAHRDLGRLDGGDDLAYEIGRSIDEVSELVGTPCRDFAIGFGGTEHVTAAALELLHQRGQRIYFGVRGINASGSTPTLLLRDMISPSWPLSFARQVALGGLDDRACGDRAQLAEWSEPLPGQQLG
ncbi:MAG: polysaccharide deacetylase family protein [Planctomycetales bacterium]|nr:polysaccharide deacetylase family protein [Planctomycetales bacterium]